jgi:transposase InsO family protein
VQWLSDNGSIFAAYRTLEIALALNLEPCFTPVESPESNGMAEAFVKTFKRDYVRINSLPDARMYCPGCEILGTFRLMIVISLQNAVISRKSPMRRGRP